MADIVALKRELDEAQEHLHYLGQMNAAPTVPIEQRIALDIAYMNAQRRMSEASAAYTDALFRAAEGRSPLSGPVLVR